MGFSSGSYAAQDIWNQLKEQQLLPKSRAGQQKVAEIIVDVFEGLDSDDWDYEEGSVYQVARPKEVEEYHSQDEEDDFDDDDDGADVDLDDEVFDDE